MSPVFGKKSDIFLGMCDIFFEMCLIFLKKTDIFLEKSEVKVRRLGEMKYKSGKGWRSFGKLKYMSRKGWHSAGLGRRVWDVSFAKWHKKNRFTLVIQYETVAICSGQRWIRTTEGVSQQIYSLPHLATLVFALFARLRCKDTNIF